MSSEPLIRPGLSTAIKKNLPKIKAKLRAKVPNLTLDDIRIRTRPYLEILRYDLCDKGYQSSLVLFDGMIENDGKLYRGKLLHELSDDVTEILVKFTEELIAAEETIDDTSAKGKILLSLATYFEKFYHLFPWTTQKLYETALNSVSINDKFTHSLVLYHYANFLLHKQHASELASIKIQTALDLARENEKWAISENDESTSLIKCVVLLYFQIFLQRARQMMASVDKQEAQQIAARVIQMIGDSFSDDPMTKCRCYDEYGDFLQTNKLFLKAIDAYMSSKGEAHKLKDFTMQCKAQFNVASCYKELKNFVKAEKYTKTLYDIARDNQQEFWMAEALLLLADLYSKNNQNPQKSIMYAEEALEIFQTCPPFPHQQQKLNQARLIVAKLKADKMYPSYLNNIYLSETGSLSHFFNLLNWQISRKFVE